MAGGRWDHSDVTQRRSQTNPGFSDPSERRSARADEGLLSRGTWAPPVDIVELDNHELLLTAELPDMRLEDIQVTADENTLTIRGEKRPPAGVAEEQYHRIERTFGPFSRSFSLSPLVDPARISAEYRQGVLRLRLPLRKEAQPRQIRVEVG